MSYTYGSAISRTTSQPGSQVADIAHARTRTTLSRFTAAAHADTVNLVIGYFKSSDQIIDIRFYTDGGGTAGAFNLGLWTTTFSDGAPTHTVADVDLYASAKATGTAILHGSAIATVFTEAATLDDFDRGKALWAQLAIGAGSDTTDPGVTYALIADISTTIDAANELAFEVEYVAGD